MSGFVLQLWNIPVETHSELLGLVRLITKRFAPHHAKLLQILESVDVEDGSILMSRNSSMACRSGQKHCCPFTCEGENPTQQREGGRDVVSAHLAGKSSWLRRMVPLWVQHVVTPAHSGGRWSSRTNNKVEAFVAASDESNDQDRQTPPV